MKLGSINLSKMYVGVSEVIKAYIGSTQTYSNDPYYVGNFLSPELTFDFGNEYYRTDGTDTTFPSAITHSRASNATMVDNDGLLKWAPHNLLTWSESANNWAKYGVSVIPSSGTTPDGKSADLIYPSSTGTDWCVYQSGLPSVSKTHGAIVKASGKSIFCILQEDTTGGGVWFDLSAGTKSTESSGWTGSITALSDGWYLCEATSTSSFNQYSAMMFVDADNSTLSTVNGTDGGLISQMRVYRSDLGGMVDNPDRGDSYVPTTSAARYLPRRGHHVYNGASWVNEGLLHESEAKTNLTVPSNDFTPTSPSVWYQSPATNLFHTSDAAVGPDGETSADSLIEKTNTGRHGTYDTVSFTAGVNHTFSVFIKNASGSRFVRIALNTSTGVNFIYATFDPRTGEITQDATASSTSTALQATSEPWGNGWYRISVSGSTYTTGTYITVALVTSGTAPAGTDYGYESYTGDGTSGIYVYGAQLEAGSTPSSYIPTSGSTATRAAETLTIPSANLPWSPLAVSIQMQGRMTYADDDAENNTVTFLNWEAGSEQISYRIRTDSTRTGSFQVLQRTGGTLDIVEGTLTDYAPGINVPFSVASRHGTTFLQGATGGASTFENTTPTAFPDLETVDIDLLPKFNGTVKTLKLWDSDISTSGIEEASS